MELKTYMKYQPFVNGVSGIEAEWSSCFLDYIIVLNPLLAVFGLMEEYGMNLRSIFWIEK